MKYTYLLIDFGAIAVPFLFSFHPKIQLHKKWLFVWAAIILAAIPFVIWDSYFTKIGVWGFTEKYLIGTRLFWLPVEELLFFVCIPYACLFTYYCFRSLLGTDFRLPHESKVTNTILILITLLGVIFYDRMYTSWTAAGLTIFLLFMKYALKPGWLSLFYYSHMFLLIPFIIVNGMLTGTGLDQPVVWYNDAENMSMRLLTIPLEDIFYGMLMLMLNTFLFEFLMQKAGVGQQNEVIKINSFWDVVKF